MEQKKFYGIKERSRRWFLLVLCMLFVSFSYAQNKITGIVKDGNDEPLIGVNILYGKNKGTVTDMEGRFTLEAAPGTVLKVSYIGYETQTVKAGASPLSIVMKEEDNVINEVIAIGYGTAKKSDLTGAVIQVKAKDLKAVTSSDPLQALQGRAPGLSVMTDNRPDESPTMRIRGSGSLSAGNDPLYVVDGFPLMNGSLQELNANDIESIEVLKDASATAIYGSRGANGVIIVTTRSGQKNTKNMSFNATYGVQVPGRIIETLSHDQFVDFINSAYLYSKGKAVYTNENPAPDTYTDWQREIIKDSAPVQDYNLSIDGQSGDTRYLVSGGIYSQDGLLPTAYYKKYTMRTNLDHQFNKHLTIGTHLQYTYARKRTASSGTFGSGLGTVWRAGWPTLAVKDSDGNYLTPSDDSQIAGYFSDDAKWNPIANYNEIVNRKTTSRLFGDVYAEIKIIDGLTFRTNFGIDISNTRGYNFTSSKVTTGTGVGKGGNSYAKQLSKISENILTYNHRWNDHNFTATGVYSWQQYTYENLSLSGGGFLNDQTGAWDMELADKSTIDYNSTKYDNKLISLTGRVAYSYKDRYLLTATARYDGSSRFGANNKWGFFPSAGLGWRVSEEPFMKNQNVVSNLKLRASYGVTGNQEIGNYKSLAQLISTHYMYNGTELQGFYETLGNSDLKWERTKQLDLGIDLSLWNRLNITVDYYNRNTSDLLYTVPIPSTSGYSTMLSNIGKVNNRGIEVSVGGQIIDTRDFKLEATVNVSKNKNKITELYNGVESITVASNLGISKYLKVGESLTSLYAMKSGGIINTEEKLAEYRKLVPTANMGEEMYVDVDGDGSITAKDYVNIGDTEPNFFYGISLNAEYKKFHLSMLGQGANDVAFDMEGITSASHGYGDNLHYLVAGEYQLNNRNYIPSLYAYERMWSESNPNGTFARAGAQNQCASDRTSGGKHYFIIKSIALGYDFGANPFGLTKGIKGFNVTLNFQNFITFANHRGYNPENGDNSNPWAKTVSLSINAKF